MALAALPRLPPTSPDFARCDVSYGIDVAPVECTGIVNQHFPRTNGLINYYFHEPREGDAPRPAGSVQLPFRQSTESCSVEINYAGPETHSIGFIREYPVYMRGYAGYLIDSCPVNRNGLGGYITKGMGNVAQSLARIPTSLPEGTDEEHLAMLEDLMEGSANYLTISVSHPSAPKKEVDVEVKIGNTDPYIAATLEGKTIEQFLQNDDPEDKAYLANIATALRDGSLRLTNDNPDDPNTQPWFKEKVSLNDTNAADPLSETDNIPMTYDCEDNFGAPDIADCEKLSYKALGGNPLQAILVGGNSRSSNKFIEGTCAFVLDSVSPTGSYATWALVRTVFDSLTGSCLDHPLKKQSGGKAYKGDTPQKVGSWIERYVDFVKTVGGRRARRGLDGKNIVKREPTGGADVLPPKLTAYIWRYGGNFACEENMIKQGKNVDSCATA